MMISHWLAKQLSLQTVSQAPSSLPLVCIVCTCLSVLVPTHWGGMSVVIYILYDFFLKQSLSSCCISEALFCICSKNTSLHSALWKATHCIQPTLKKQLVWDFPLLKLPEHYVFNGRPKKDVWTSVMKVNILRAAERCMLSCCALCGLSQTADKRQAAGGPHCWRRGTAINVNRPHAPAALNERITMVKRAIDGCIQCCHQSAHDVRPSAMRALFVFICACVRFDLVENGDGTSV